jgi:YD repeat-containing protein
VAGWINEEAARPESKTAAIQIQQSNFESVNMPSNGQRTVNQSWTSLGAGPMTLQLITTGFPVTVIVSDTPPASGALGAELYDGHSLMPVSAGFVWVRSICGVDSIVDVLIGTPAAAAAAGGGGGAATLADGADVAGGATAQAPASWFSAAASRIQLLKLLIAATVGAGSHQYGYDANGRLISDTWTLFGVTRTKTYSYTAGGLLDSETDWV